MRRFLLTSALVLASCAPRPEQAVAPAPQPQPPLAARGLLTGLTSVDVVSRLGTPALQIREGSSVKLQFRSRLCVVDVYLYPSADGQMRVTYIDARDGEGNKVDQAACVAGLKNPI